MKKYSCSILLLLFTTASFGQNTANTCPCALNNIIATGNISFNKIKKYSATLTTFNYKSDMLFTNNTNCKMEIKSATIGDKTTFLNLVVNNIVDKKRSWLKNISHTKPFASKDGKTVALFEYKLNGITCTQKIVVNIEQPKNL